MIYLENSCLLLGRLLMGLYFIIPGISKITGYAGTVAYMETHNVPLIPVLLPLTIVIQITAGVTLIIGYQGKIAALVLAGLTLLISVYMHNFWGYEPGMERNHETQNFIKNMAIMAGLLVIAALGTGRFSLSDKLSKPGAN